MGVGKGWGYDRGGGRTRVGVGVGEFTPCDRAQMGKGALPLEPFLSFWNPKSVDVSRRTQGTGWDLQVKQVRQVRRGSF